MQLKKMQSKFGTTLRVIFAHSFPQGIGKRLQPTSMLPHTFSNLLAITIEFQLYLSKLEQQLASTTEIRTACF